MENQYHPHPVLNAAYELALAPTYEFPSDFDPATASTAAFREHNVAAYAHDERFIKPQTVKLFNLMEEHRIPHPPKAKAQYDKGIITAPEYASLLTEAMQHS